MIAKKLDIASPSQNARVPFAPSTNTMGVPKIELGPDLTTVKFLRKDPMMLYGIFVELLRQIYSADTSASVAGTYIWDQDKNKSQIWIDTEANYNDDLPDVVPCIYVELPGIQYSSHTGLTKGLYDMNMEEGEYLYSRVGRGQVNLIHTGNTKGDGVILATNTFNYMDAFADIIRKEFCFDKLYVIGFNPLQVVKKEREKFRSVLSMAFEFQETFVVKLESPKLKKLVINAGQALLGLLDS